MSRTDLLLVGEAADMSVARKFGLERSALMAHHLFT